MLLYPLLITASLGYSPMFMGRIRLLPYVEPNSKISKEGISTKKTFKILRIW
jgi:hypothetical protein